MNLNTIRLEGKMMNDHFFDTADRQGMLVMPGWCCCSYWERWRNWKPEDYQIAGESLRDQIRRLRNHPERLRLALRQRRIAERRGRDGLPEGARRGALAEPVRLLRRGPHHHGDRDHRRQDDRPVRIRGAELLAAGHGKRGGAFGFNTETSPGPAIPVLASLKEMLPKDHLWPIDEFWNFHAGGGSYRNVNVFTAALEGRYGKAQGPRRLRAARASS